MTYLNTGLHHHVRETAPGASGCRGLYQTQGARGSGSRALLPDTRAARIVVRHVRSAKSAHGG
ncbi:MAG: hypothetical protein QOG83_2874 [Alphaproteobacteria bacterium]|nr:hypothetical protein [Alphaproteobacteria bacterium]